MIIFLDEILINSKSDMDVRSTCNTFLTAKMRELSGKVRAASILASHDEVCSGQNLLAMAGFRKPN